VLSEEYLELMVEASNGFAMRGLFKFGNRETTRCTNSGPFFCKMNSHLQMYVAQLVF